MSKLRISYSTSADELKGTVSITGTPEFMLEAFASALDVAAKSFDVPFDQLLQDIWKTHYVQNRV